MPPSVTWKPIVGNKSPRCFAVTTLSYCYVFWFFQTVACHISILNFKWSADHDGFVVKVTTTIFVEAASTYTRCIYYVFEPVCSARKSENSWSFSSSYEDTQNTNDVLASVWLGFANIVTGQLKEVYTCNRTIGYNRKHEILAFIISSVVNFLHFLHQEHDKIKKKKDKFCSWAMGTEPWQYHRSQAVK